MKVECEVEEIDMENERGGTQPGVKVTCSRCQHAEQSFGTTERSVKRCFILLKDKCPNDENNFYTGGPP